MNLLRIVLIMVLPLSVMAEKEEIWFTGEVEYEGYPLLLRFPEEKNYEEVQPLRPKFIWVTHHLAKVTSNGLPEKKYNESLEDFDLMVIKNCECIVLVETFNGRRNYYGYVSKEFDLERVMRSIKDTFPEENMEWNSKIDENWKFIKQYAKDFNLYKTKD